jgi:hypothetical protein
MGVLCVLTVEEFPERTTRRYPADRGSYFYTTTGIWMIGLFAGTF